jgi:hypothetical protein
MLGLMFYGPSTVNAWAQIHEDDRALHRTSTLTAWETPKDVHGFAENPSDAPPAAFSLSPVESTDSAIIALTESRWTSQLPCQVRRMSEFHDGILSD